MTNIHKHAVVAIALATAGLVAVAAPAGAQTLDSVRQVVVRYDDLDMGHAAGQAVLRQRVENAASAVCGPAPDLRLLNDWSTFRKCRTAAIETAGPQLDRARLDANPQLASR
jgi:UrcA family protein